jgi:hypothetical protein
MVTAFIFNNNNDINNNNDNNNNDSNISIARSNYNNYITVKVTTIKTRIARNRENCSTL